MAHLLVISRWAAWSTLLLPLSVAHAFIEPKSYPLQPRGPACSFKSYPLFSEPFSLSTNDIRFLGQGPNAIVRPGAVLVAPTNEFHHFYRRAAIFIYAMGEDEDMDDTYVIRGAIVDHPTPFTLGEMAESTVLQDIEANPMAMNLIYRGGDKGGDKVFMLHNQDSIGDGEMIGTSGIFQGGLQQALEACRVGKAQPEDFKFFFNFCQFTEEEIESMLADDPWISVEVPPNYILHAEWDRGDCWKQLRNALKQDMHEMDDI